MYMRAITSSSLCSDEKIGPHRNKNEIRWIRREEKKALVLWEVRTKILQSFGRRSLWICRVCSGGWQSNDSVNLILRWEKELEGENLIACSTTFCYQECIKPFRKKYHYTDCRKFLLIPVNGEVLALNAMLDFGTFYWLQLHITSLSLTDISPNLVVKSGSNAHFFVVSLTDDSNQSAISF